MPPLSDMSGKKTCAGLCRLRRTRAKMRKSFAQFNGRLRQGLQAAPGKLMLSAVFDAHKNGGNKTGTPAREKPGIPVRVQKIAQSGVKSGDVGPVAQKKDRRMPQSVDHKRTLGKIPQKMPHMASAFRITGHLTLSLPDTVRANDHIIKSFRKCRGYGFQHIAAGVKVILMQYGDVLAPRLRKQKVPVVRYAKRRRIPSMGDSRILVSFCNCFNMICCRIIGNKTFPVCTGLGKEVGKCTLDSFPVFIGGNADAEKRLWRNRHCAMAFFSEMPRPSTSVNRMDG